MLITANGKPVEISGEVSVTKLLAELKVDQSEYVSVQLDGEMLLRANFDTTLVKKGAIVEFLYYMGGGRPGMRTGIAASSGITPCSLPAASSVKGKGGCR